MTPNPDQNIWHSFPTNMGDDQASIFFNESYAEVAAQDKLHYLLRVELAFQEHTDIGLPSNSEFDALCALEDDLEKYLLKLNGVYVGRISVGGRRFLYFYLPSCERRALKATKKVEKLHGYQLFTQWSQDVDKSAYWQQLYPTDDDWQIIRDLRVLNVLYDNNDNPETVRNVDHWAYFNQPSQADQFKQWLESERYKNIEIEPVDEQNKIRVRFSHDGNMALGELTRHTIPSNRKAKELGGYYDGWETSIEK